MNRRSFSIHTFISSNSNIGRILKPAKNPDISSCSFTSRMTPWRRKRCRQISDVNLLGFPPYSFATLRWKLMENGPPKRCLSPYNHEVNINFKVKGFWSRKWSLCLIFFPCAIEKNRRLFHQSTSILNSLTYFHVTNK